MGILNAVGKGVLISAAAAIAAALFFASGCTSPKPTGPAPTPAKVVRFSKDTLLWNIPFVDTLHAHDLGAALSGGTTFTVHLVDSRQGMSVKDSVFSWTPKDTGDIYINGTICGEKGRCDTLRDTFHIRFSAAKSRAYRLGRDTITRFVKFTDTIRPDSSFKARFGDALFTLRSLDTIARLEIRDSILSLLCLDTGRVRFRLVQSISSSRRDTLSISIIVKNGQLPSLSFKFRKDSLCLYQEYKDTLRQSRFSATAAMGRLSGFAIVKSPAGLTIKDSFFVWTPDTAGKLAVEFAARDTSGRYYGIKDTFFVRFCPPEEQCPPYTHKTDATMGLAKDLPNGFFIYTNDYYASATSMAPKPGLFKSDLKTFSPSVIPGTEEIYPRGVQISDDGKWILYAAEDKAYFIRTDGSSKVRVPITGVGVCSVTLNRRSPYGLEVCYTPLDTTRAEIYAIQVTLDSVPVFGTARKIVDLTGSFRIEAFYPFCIEKDQVIGAFSPKTPNGYILRTGFLTIPGGGTQTAGPKDMFAWRYDNGEQYWGCNFAMSHDGLLCLYLPGSAGFGDYPNCIAKEHQGFVVTPFRRKGDSAITMDDHVAVYGLSINWSPSQYNFGKWDEIDFHGWNFGNRNDLAIGALSGTLAPHRGVWIVDWRRNIWTMLTPKDSTINADQPAVYFTDTSTGNPLDPHYRVIRPNGGEAFTVGQPCTVSVTSQRDGNAAVRISLENGKYSFMLPGLTTAINPKVDSVIVFTIPATFTLQQPDPNTGALKDVQISSVSDACKICIEDYNPVSGFADCSDAVFKIKAAK